MTQDFIMGQLRLALVAFLAFAGGKGWITPTDAGFATAMATSLGPLLAPWIWSIYRNINGKVVPKNSVAIETSNVQGVATQDGKTVVVSTDGARVVG